jgi:septum formation protein
MEAREKANCKGAPEAVSLQSTAMLILASASPRRRDLLRSARILFKADPADIPEQRREGELPREFAERLAREKAELVYARLRPGAGELVLGADTVVIVDGEVLGKPEDEADAARMLRQLSGRGHEVTTGVCLVGAPNRADGAAKAGFVDVRSETTQVLFAPLTDEEIDDYLTTGEPMDKAGAYAIQGAASRWIPRIEGCYFNVVGLPVPLVCRMLREHGAL